MKKSPCDLAQLERTLAEAKKIPVHIESVKRLEKCVDEAQKLIETVDSLYSTFSSKSSSQPPHLANLIKMAKLGKQLPIKLSQVNNLTLRINFAQDWNAKLNAHRTLIR